MGPVHALRRRAPALAEELDQALAVGGLVHALRGLDLNLHGQRGGEDIAPRTLIDIEPERQGRRGGMLDRPHAGDLEAEPWLVTRRRRLLRALPDVGLDRGRAGCSAVALAHPASTLARPRSSSKNTGTARSTASPPEIPSQVALIAPTRE